ncbi:axoneme-associated protein mst101(2)-like [Homarus americanus]|uniref:Transcription factor TFIIIB component B''-like n=1 Tax=Homarus americanus TaxID=6706 RepID=A0A8J5MVF5_HOMAM|nr:axoneme-associated protein mst101(2)-like [Homarus americanus]XP_042230346.1 axoneme-associated protein mst101(2)-like [Homarus americanus]KAG7164479.1 Transcription factor TFIIIB component B''-like [Homarus americanus]
MRRMKIRATPNIGGGGGPRNTQARGVPSSTTPPSTAPTSLAPPSTAPTSLAPPSTVPSMAPPSATSSITTPSSTTPSSLVPPTTSSMTPLISTSTTPWREQNQENVMGPTEEKPIANVNIVTPGNQQVFSNSAVPVDLMIDALDEGSTPLSSSFPSNTPPLKDIIKSPQKSQVFSSLPSQTSLKLKASSSASSQGPLQPSHSVMPLTSPAVKKAIKPPVKLMLQSEPSEALQKVSENKPLSSTRRKKLKVMPMVSSFRKGSVVEKPSTSTGNVGAQIKREKFDVEVECLGDRPKDQQEQNTCEENLACGIDEQDSKPYLLSEKEKDLEMKTATEKREHTARMDTVNDNNEIQFPIPSTKTQIDLKDKNKPFQTTKESRKSLAKESENEGDAKKSEILVSVDESQTCTAGESRGSRFSEDSQGTVASTIDSSSTAISGTCKRRSKIRAAPTLLAKRKMVKKAGDIQEEKVEIVNADSPVAHSISGKSRRQADKCNEEITITEPDCVREKSLVDSCNGTEPSQSLKVEINQMQKLCEVGENGPEKPKKKTDIGVEKKDCNIVGKKMKRKKNNVDREEQGGVEIIEDNSNSDDSCGDKENSKILFSSSQAVKKESPIKERSKSFGVQKTKAKSSSVVGPRKTFIKTGKSAKISAKSDKGLSQDESKEKTEKQIFRERKETYRKKMVKGALERSSMTMFDLIFWNPATNPMPGRSEVLKKKARLTSKSETESTTSDVIEEQKVDDLGLDTVEPAPQSRPNSPDEDQEGKEPSQPPSPQAKDDEEEEEAAAAGEEETPAEDIFTPRVKIGPNGQIILDEQSIKIQTTAAKNRDEILSKTEVVEESNESSHSKWSKKRHRSSEWTLKETARFYKALSTVGTDFSLMEALFTWRSRAELKTKFKKEERINRELVDRALKDCTQFDLSLFDDESDYDPEEDRKATRMAERAEAKRKRLEMKQSEKEREKQEKKTKRKGEQAKIKTRKRVLRRERKRKKIKRKDADENGHKESSDCEDQGLGHSDTEGEHISSVQKCSNGENKINKKKGKVKRPAKKRQLEERNSLVISEVTVTMETVKYDMSSQSRNECTPEKTVAENVEKDEDNVDTNPSISEATPKTENNQKVWHFPVSAIQTQDDGRQTILVPTADGQKSVPVPVLPPGTSNVLVMATGAPDSPGEHIYHVYVVSPVEGTES